MRATLKSLQDINTLSDTVVYGGRKPKSGKPALPTTHILELQMRKSERDRIVKELKRIKKRKRILTQRLSQVEKEMDKLLTEVSKSAQILRGEKEEVKNPGRSRKGNMVLEY